MIYIDTEEHLKGFPHRYVALPWSDFTRRVSECVADAHVYLDSDAACLEEILCSYTWTHGRELDDEAVDEWCAYVVMNFLRDGFVPLWTTSMKT